MNVFNNISVPLLFECSVYPFKYPLVIVLSCCIKKIFFSVMFDSVTLQESLFTNKVSSANNFAISSCCLFINMNYKVTWVFSKGRFDVALHIFIKCTLKNFHLNLTIFQRMRDFMSSNMFVNIIIKDYHFFYFFYLYWVIFFPIFFGNGLPLFSS